MTFTIIDYFLQAIAILIFIRVIVSWFIPESDNPIVRFIYEVTNPILVPISRFTTYGSIDFSPMIVILVIEIIREILRRFLF